MKEKLYDLAGGADGVYRLASAFYRRVLADPLLLPLFADPNEDHVGRMALWLGEFFGGHTEHTKQRGGFPVAVGVHGRLQISDDQRKQWLKHMLAACAEVQLAEQVKAFFVPEIHAMAMAAQRFSHQ